ncbi:putative guanine nucleotide exchange factor MCF2L2 [Platysternon megacephalum]|uniref:Putative guanine nucleotide exchange factor MCF2L2 n=1 Tax=Platysternon megacephalum TaxID=55544 RepID=A0A4D9DZY3_9SAUR|nr:putative guanine nucleotide exchange factor MCF2L2 [Platysternon megacephalum]
MGQPRHSCLAHKALSPPGLTRCMDLCTAAALRFSTNVSREPRLGVGLVQNESRGTGHGKAKGRTRGVAQELRRSVASFPGGAGSARRRARPKLATPPGASPCPWSPAAMRCFPKRLLATALTLLGLLLLLSLCLQRPEDPLVEEVKHWAQEMVLQQLQPEGNLRSFQDLWNTSASRNVSYRYLAGHPPSRKKFLTVGLSSVKRKRGNYLLDTLKSIFKQSTQEELEEMVVVVHLADPDSEWNTQVVMDITARFTPHLLRGQLLVIHAPPECYPPLEGLKRNYNDAED